MFPFEFRVEYDRTVYPVARDAIRIRYRKPGTRRWERFLLVGDEGETLQSLDAKVEPAILEHAKL